MISGKVPKVPQMKARRSVSHSSYHSCKPNNPFSTEVHALVNWVTPWRRRFNLWSWRLTAGSHVLTSQDLKEQRALGRLQQDLRPLGFSSIPWKASPGFKACIHPLRSQLKGSPSVCGENIPEMPGESPSWPIFPLLCSLHSVSRFCLFLSEPLLSLNNSDVLSKEGFMESEHQEKRSDRLHC